MDTQQQEAAAGAEIPQETAMTNETRKLSELSINLLGDHHAFEQ